MPATIFYRRVEMKKPLPDKVAIINGGVTGMGRSIALCFAEEGCSCVIADINEIDGKKTAAEATKKGKECVFIHHISPPSSPARR
jgi:NAD(P)-dependent dehydrogenase (short-subunit alcohol dehydrogenase family)